MNSGVARTLRVVDLFSGCGGMSLGLMKAGLEVVGAFDYWLAANRVYQLNFEHPIITMDLNDTTVPYRVKQFRPDIIVGGPPCQDFSSAGKRDEDLGRGDLTVRFARVVKDVRPKWFIMENVPRIMKTRRLFQATAIFEACGYGLSTRILDASYCGVPQLRTRFFMIGERDGQHGALEPILDSNQASERMTLRQYFGSRLGVENYYRHPRNYSRRAIYSVDEPSPTVRGVNRPVPRGYPGHPLDSTPLSSDIRPLTTRERALVQTFPSDFQFAGTTSELEQMIGNAVPVNLAEYVGRCLMEHICTTEPTVARGAFLDSRRTAQSQSQINLLESS